MNARQKEIINQSILLFNAHGVSNVKLSDITVALDISLGNLTYYYKTKKDLIGSILDFMNDDQENLLTRSEQFLGDDNWEELIKNYLLFQLKYCFFYRDIISLDAYHEKAKSMYESEVNKVIAFNKNSIYMAIGRGYIHPEPRKGLYDGLAENAWSIIQAWFIKRSVFGAEKVQLSAPFRNIMDLYYPFATEDGIAVLDKLRKRKNILVK